MKIRVIKYLSLNSNSGPDLKQNYFLFVSALKSFTKYEVTVVTPWLMYRHERRSNDSSNHL